MTDTQLAEFLVESLSNESPERYSFMDYINYEMIFFTTGIARTYSQAIEKQLDFLKERVLEDE
jgi:hypothetical protein